MQKELDPGPRIAPQDHDILIPGQFNHLAQQAMGRYLCYFAGMNLELLILGMIGGGLVGGATVGALATQRLQKHLKKQGFQINTIEELYKEVQRSSIQVEKNYLETIEALIRALEARDTYTKGHSDRVNKMSVAIAKAMGLSDEEVLDIHHGSLLHDIGKIGVYDRILLKPQGLNAEEFELMQAHPSMGAEMLAHSEQFKKHIPIILHHHERQDGSGYPLKLKGDEIPLGARIVQVADSWDAMTSDRPYRRRMESKEAAQRLREASGTQLDARVVEAFFDALLKPRGIEV